MTSTPIACPNCGEPVPYHIPGVECAYRASKPHQPDASLTLDEWAERYAKDLREDIRCHIRNCEQEDVDRYILISIRQWFEEMGNDKPETCPTAIGEL